MKRIFLLCLMFATLSVMVMAQDAKYISKGEEAIVLTDQVKEDHGIKFPVFRTYLYEDNSGKHYLALTEHAKPGAGKDIMDKIKAFNLKLENGRFTTVWTAKDFVDSKKEEKTMWFWTKYLTTLDLDNDGNVEPILVYGTKGVNGFDDGRIKILTYYKGVKYAIRHQNGSLDHERNTQVDKGFYELPKVVQDKVKSIMKKIEANNQGIFPAGWEDKMKSKTGHIWE